LGRVRLGSDAHKTLFCRTLVDTFDPYKPAVIDWPELDAEARERLVSLPIRDIAVQTEGRARLNVASYAAVSLPSACSNQRSAPDSLRKRSSARSNPSFKKKRAM
jgi:hypothetical protein